MDRIKRARITIHLDPEQLEAVDKTARENGVSISTLARLAFKQFLAAPHITIPSGETGRSQYRERTRREPAEVA